MCPTTAVEPLTIDHPVFDQIQQTTDWYEKNSHARYLRDAGMSKKGDDLIQCDRGDLLHIECASGHRRTVAYSCNQRFHPECQEQNLKAAMLRYNRKLEYLAQHHRGAVVKFSFSLPLPESLTVGNAVALRSAYKTNMDRVTRIGTLCRDPKTGQDHIFTDAHCTGVIGNQQMFSLFLYTNTVPTNNLLNKLSNQFGRVCGTTFELYRSNQIHIAFERHLKVLEPDSDEHAAANEIISHGTRSRRPRTYVPIPKTIPDLFPEEEEPIGNNLEVEESPEPVTKGRKCHICGKPCTVRVEYRLHGRLREGYLDRLAPSD